MSNVNFKQKAERVLKKLNDKDYGFHTAAVFLNGTVIQFMNIHSKKFDKHVNDFPKTFVGVYNCSAKVGDIAEDIEHTYKAA